MGGQSGKEAAVAHRQGRQQLQGGEHRIGQLCPCGTQAEPTQQDEKAWYQLSRLRALVRLNPDMLIPI